MKDFLVEHVVFRNSTEVKKLVHIWEQSVRATHLFLTETDITMLIPDVKVGIEGIDKLMVVKDQSGEPFGFMGVANSKIEMLFISPEYFGRGLGALLINYAINVLGAHLVDVNEQNPKALGFYKHSGFEVYDRSETDEQGRPFPILHMKLTQGTSVK